MGDRVLLPTNVVPDTYHVHLTPDLVNFTFAGKDRIHITVKEDTATVVLHCLDIEIASGSVTVGGETVAISEFAYDREMQTVTLHPARALKAGESGDLELVFTGILNDQMAGFYRSKYTLDGKDAIMAVTQFEATDARRAFPCWDEPAVKAKFNITLTVPKDQDCMSNMLPTSETVEGDLKTVVFDETPIVSSYLVAFLVGVFDYVEDFTKDKIRVRIYTPKGKKELGTFALRCAVQTLEYYTEYYGVAYPLPKSDMVAIPDFAAGAMENWGLITYRETALLVDEARSPITSKQRVAYVVAHELAHQWFGNLVTMQWWKELWLNEGFATWVGNQAVDNMFPEWNIWTQFLADYIARAMQLDGLVSSHPIEVDVSTAAEINEIFDAISYMKGASVIRMVHDLIGDDAFRKGLNIYLKRHQFANAVTTDLWAAFSEVSGQDVAAFMGNWTARMGYPVVSVEEVSKGKLKVSQRRFLNSGGECSEGTLWNIRLNVTTSTCATPQTVVLTDASMTVDVDPAATWVMVNSGGFGFYRVHYTSDLLERLCAVLPQHSPEDRFTLQNDVFALAQAGVASTADALAMASRYGTETNTTVWQGVLGNLGTVRGVWQGQPSFDGLQVLQRTLVGEAVAACGWDPKEGEGDDAGIRRTLLLGAACRSGADDAIAEAQRRFAARDTTPLANDLRLMIYGTVVKHGGKAEMDAMRAIFDEADMNEERVRALQALGMAATPELIDEALAFALSGAVRPQDVVYVFATASASAHGRVRAWATLCSRWDDFQAMFKDAGFIMARIISNVTVGFADRERADEIRAFFETHSCPSAERTIKQSLEAIETRAAWLIRDGAAVAAFLSKK